MPESAVPFVPHHLDMERLQSFCFAPVPARPTGAGKSEDVGAKSSYAVILLNGDSPVTCTCVCLDTCTRVFCAGSTGAGTGGVGVANFAGNTGWLAPLECLIL